MRKTLSVLAIIAALSSSALAESSATLSGGTLDAGCFFGNGNVTISEGGSVTLDNLVYGKEDDGASVSGASVTMTGGTIEADIRGGDTSKVATNNTVEISGGTVTGNVIGAYAQHGASANTVTISGGQVQGYVMGGNDMQEDANNNTVIISSGQVENFVRGGSSISANANGNKVTISGGEVAGEVCGGYGGNGNANGNKVTISGGSIKGDVRGGYTNAEYGTKNTIYNTVNLVGEGATLDTLTGSSFTIEGGVSGGNGNSIDNNTLNVYGKGITVNKFIGAFETTNFYLAPGIQNGDTILTAMAFEAQKLNVKCDGDTQLNDGDTVTLVHTTLGAYYTESNVDIIKGVTASYSGKVTTDGTDLVLTVGDDAPETNDDALKSMTETRTDVAALVNAAADFMATTGVQQAKLAAKVAALTSKDGVAPFVALGGSSMRYNTGSHVNADGFNGALGVAKAFDDITLGLAGEYGISNYKSYVGSTSAKGDSKLYGGALLADWQGKQGWHAESALRLGRAFTDYSAMTALGGTHYTDHASYQGIMLGGGKEMKVSKKCDDTIDLYARYFYSHTNASHTTATSGEGIHFSSVNSHRTMVGARYNHELCDTATLYAGAAWMHEFDGDAHSVIGGFTSPSPSLEGDSGMVEIGTTFAPCSSENILLNLNLQGWTGVQRGISGGAGCTIKF